LLCCCECRKHWHHRCHIPPVEDGELVRRLRATNDNDIDNGLDGWACRRCLRTAGKGKPAKTVEQPDNFKTSPPLIETPTAIRPGVASQALGKVVVAPTDNGANTWPISPAVQTVPEIDDFAMNVDPVDSTQLTTQVYTSPPSPPTQATTVQPHAPGPSVTDSASTSTQAVTTNSRDSVLDGDDDMEDLYWNPPSPHDTIPGFRSPMRLVSPPPEPTADQLGSDALSAGRELDAVPSSGISEPITWWMHQRHPDQWYSNKLRRKVHMKKLDESREPILAYFFFGDFIRSQKALFGDGTHTK